MTTRDYSNARDIVAWLKPIISNEGWFGDGPPEWREAQTGSKAHNERAALIKVLRRRPKQPILRPLISRLKSCRSHQRCHSGACPECTRALQRYFVSRVQRLPIDFICLSLISEPVVSGQLDTLDMIAFHVRIKRLLRDVGVGIAVGGVDYSVNMDLDKQFPEHWSVHLWLLIPDVYVGWESKLNKSISKTYCTPRPVWTTSFDGNSRGIAYAIKNNFDRRISYVEEFPKRTRNTRDAKMRVWEKRELAHYLSKAGLGSRLFFLSPNKRGTPQALFYQLSRSPPELTSFARRRRSRTKANR